MCVVCVWCVCGVCVCCLNICEDGCGHIIDTNGQWIHISSTHVHVLVPPDESEQLHVAIIINIWVWVQDYMQV